MGAERYPLPTGASDAASMSAWKEEFERVRAETELAGRGAAVAEEADRTHGEIQSWLRDLGLDVRSQLLRPAFRAIGNLRVRFLPYSELETHRETICRFGQGMKPIEAIARSLF